MHRVVSFHVAASRWSWLHRHASSTTPTTSTTHSSSKTANVALQDVTRVINDRRGSLENLITENKTAAPQSSQALSKAVINLRRSLEEALPTTIDEWINLRQSFMNVEGGEASGHLVTGIRKATLFVMMLAIRQAVEAVSKAKTRLASQQGRSKKKDDPSGESVASVASLNLSPIWRSAVRLCMLCHSKQMEEEASAREWATIVSVLAQLSVDTAADEGAASLALEVCIIISSAARALKENKATTHRDLQSLLALLQWVSKAGVPHAEGLGRFFEALDAVTAVAVDALANAPPSFIGAVASSASRIALVGVPFTAAASAVSSTTIASEIVQRRLLLLRAIAHRPPAFWSALSRADVVTILLALERVVGGLSQQGQVELAAARDAVADVAALLLSACDAAHEDAIHVRDEALDTSAALKTCSRHLQSGTLKIETARDFFVSELAVLQANRSRVGASWTATLQSIAGVVNKISNDEVAQELITSHVQAKLSATTDAVVQLSHAATEAYAAAANASPELRAHIIREYAWSSEAQRVLYVATALKKLSSGVHTTIAHDFLRSQLRVIMCAFRDQFMLMFSTHLRDAALPESGREDAHDSWLDVRCAALSAAFKMCDCDILEVEHIHLIEAAIKQLADDTNEDVHASQCHLLAATLSGIATDAPQACFAPPYDELLYRAVAAMSTRITSVLAVNPPLSAWLSEYLTAISAITSSISGSLPEASWRAVHTVLSRVDLDNTFLSPAIDAQLRETWARLLGATPPSIRDSEANSSAVAGEAIKILTTITERCATHSSMISESEIAVLQELVRLDVVCDAVSFILSRPSAEAAPLKDALSSAIAYLLCVLGRFTVRDNRLRLCQRQYVQGIKALGSIIGRLDVTNAFVRANQAELLRGVTHLVEAVDRLSHISVPDRLAVVRAVDTILRLALSHAVQEAHPDTEREQATRNLNTRFTSMRAAAARAVTASLSNNKPATPSDNPDQVSNNITRLAIVVSQAHRARAFSAPAWQALVLALGDAKLKGLTLPVPAVVTVFSHCRVDAVASLPLVSGSSRLLADLLDVVIAAAGQYNVDAPTLSRVANGARGLGVFEPCKRLVKAFLAEDMKEKSAARAAVDSDPLAMYMRVLEYIFASVDSDDASVTPQEDDSSGSTHEDVAASPGSAAVVDKELLIGLADRLFDACGPRLRATTGNDSDAPRLPLSTISGIVRLRGLMKNLGIGSDSATGELARICDDTLTHGELTFAAVIPRLAAEAPRLSKGDAVRHLAMTSVWMTESATECDVAHIHQGLQTMVQCLVLADGGVLKDEDPPMPLHLLLEAVARSATTVTESSSHGRRNRAVAAKALAAATVALLSHIERRTISADHDTVCTVVCCVMPALLANAAFKKSSPPAVIAGHEVRDHDDDPRRVVDFGGSIFLAGRLLAALTPETASPADDAHMNTCFCLATVIMAARYMKSAVTRPRSVWDAIALFVSFQHVMKWLCSSSKTAAEWRAGVIAAAAAVETMTDPPVNAAWLVGHSKSRSAAASRIVAVLLKSAGPPGASESAPIADEVRLRQQKDLRKALQRITASVAAAHTGHGAARATEVASYCDTVLANEHNGAALLLLVALAEMWVFAEQAVTWQARSASPQQLVLLQQLLHAEHVIPSPGLLQRLSHLTKS